MNENVKVVFGLIPIFSKFVACISPKGNEIAVIVNEKIHSLVYPRRSKITHKQTGKGNNIMEEQKKHGCIYMNRDKDAIYTDLMKEAEAYGIRVVSFKEIPKPQRLRLKEYFFQEVLPLLSVMIVGRKQPFPFLKGQEIYAMAILDKKKGKEKIGIIPCDSMMIPRMIEIPGMTNTYILREELVLHYMKDVFSNYHIQQKSVMRLTRNADIDVNKVYDEDLNYRDQMAQVVKLRKKLAPVRLELTRDIDPFMVEKLCDYLELDESHVLYSHSPLDLSFVFEMEDKLRNHTELFFESRCRRRNRKYPYPQHCRTVLRAFQNLYLWNRGA